MAARSIHPYVILSASLTSVVTRQTKSTAINIETFRKLHFVHFTIECRVCFSMDNITNQSSTIRANLVRLVQTQSITRTYMHMFSRTVCWKCELFPRSIQINLTNKEERGRSLIISFSDNKPTLRFSTALTRY